MTGEPPRAVVVGAGASGLAAARRFALEGHRVLVLEASDRAGGVIRTERRDGLVLERGPDSFLSTRGGVLSLVRGLGLEGELVGTPPEHRRAFVVRRRRLVPVPGGFQLVAPTSAWPMVATPLFSPLGKLRMALDLVLPARRGGGEESVASLVRRRLGREALDRLVGAMVGGVHAADPERLSVEAAFPELASLEREHRSLILGLRRRRTAPLAGAGADRPAASGPRYGLFASFRGGMQALVEALGAALPEGGLRLGTPVRALRRAGGLWRVEPEAGPALDCEALCLALPAHESARLLAGEAPGLSRLLAEVDYGSTATVNLAYRREEVAHPLDGMGLVVPPAEGLAFLGCSFSSVKFPGRAPEGTVLLRAFVGGDADPLAWEREDADLVSAVHRDLAPLLGLAGVPVATLVSRHRRALPRYTLGHLGRLARIEEEAARLGGLALAGNGLRGAGVPDCLARGSEAAGVVARVSAGAVARGP